MLAARPPRQHRGTRRLDGDHQDVRTLLLEVAANSRDGAPGARTVDERVDLPIELRPELGSGGLVVDARIRWIGELVRQPRARLVADRHVTAGRRRHPVAVNPLDRLEDFLTWMAERWLVANPPPQASPTYIQDPVKWQAALREFINNQTSRATNADDSRESIYEGRGE